LKYRLIYTNRALRDIRKLEAGVKDRIGKALEKFATDPLGQAEKLTNAELGTYRFRIGPYRAVFDLIGNDIVVLRIGHRSQIYRK
jgi:mRNA interferase RelE/StbE